MTDVLADGIRIIGVFLEHPVSGMVRMLASPMHFRNAPIDYRRAPPSLGEHDTEIRAELSGN